MNFKAVEFVKRPGVLAIVLTDAGRAEVEEIRRVRDQRGIVNALYEVTEYQLANGWDVLNDDDLVAIDALTGNDFILSDSLERDDQDKLVKVGSVYWNSDYAIQDEIELLLTKGEFILVEAE